MAEVKELKLKPHQCLYKCKKCKKVTVHDCCGFIGHNYRKVCSKCDSWNYADYPY